jgi:hypothetical protein
MDGWVRRGAPSAAERQFDALGRVEDLADHYPCVRPAGEAALMFAERAALDLGEDDGDVPDEIVEEGVGLLAFAERRATVASFTDRYSCEWRSLCDDIGDAARAELLLVESAVRAAIGERRARPRWKLELLDDPAIPPVPSTFLACALAPERVWSLADAEDAAVAGALVERLRAGWEHAIADVVAARLEFAHVRRIRTLAARLMLQLPLDGLPRVSSVLARGCAQVTRDPLFVGDVALSLLGAYVVFLTGPPAFRDRN